MPEPADDKGRKPPRGVPEEDMIAERKSDTSDELAYVVRDAAAAIFDQGIRGRITIVADKGRKPPRGFPRGELICVKSDGRLVRSYPALAVLNFLASISRGKQ